MADIIEQMTPEQLRTALRAFMSAFTLARTGDVWDATDADGADLVFEAGGTYISDLRDEFNNAGNDLLPGPESPYLGDMVALVGVTREAGESNDSLWRRRGVKLTAPSLGSPVALRDLVVLSIDGAADVSFVTQNDGSQQVSLVSSLAPPAGQLGGIPTAEQNAALLALLNNGRSHHIGRDFSVATPTALAYTPVLTVYYYASETPDFAALQTRLADSLEAFVVSARRLGVPITRFDLYVAAEVAGVTYVEGGFYTDDITSGRPTELEILTPANKSTFYSCEAQVNHVANLAAGTNGEINLIWTEI